MKTARILNDILHTDPDKRIEYINKLDVENIDDFILYGDKTYWGYVLKLFIQLA